MSPPRYEVCRACGVLHERFNNHTTLTVVPHPKLVPTYADLRASAARVVCDGCQDFQRAVDRIHAAPVYQFSAPLAESRLPIQKIAS